MRPSAAGSRPAHRRELKARLPCDLRWGRCQSRDSFNVSVGFGEGSKRPPFELPPRDQATQKPAIFRLSVLKADFARDEWWLVDSGAGEPFGAANPLPMEECAARIPALLDDAFAQLAEQALPFFREVARLRGSEIAL